MKEVGIVTWHRYHNYGTVLQAYALQETINLYCNGYNAKIINYYSEKGLYMAGESPHRLYKPQNPQPLYYTLFHHIYCKEIRQRFIRFEVFINNYLKLSGKYLNKYELQKAPPAFDLYLTGSDQVWNFKYNWNDELLPYFLWFTRSSNKISYGCGMAGSDNVRYPIPSKYYPMIGVYKAILPREEKSCQVLKRLANGKLQHTVLDPALLLLPEDYEALMRLPRKKSNYVLGYLFDYEKENYRRGINLLQKAADDRKADAVLINNTIPVNYKRIHTLISAGPDEWLGLIKNARVVITNSYHGLIFSVLFQKEMILIGLDERKVSLLKQIGLGNLIEEKPLSGMITIKKTDYKKSTLDTERKRCINLLQQCMDECKEYIYES